MSQINVQTTRFQDAARILLGVMMIFAGIGHLTFSRIEFQAQVPDWVPLSKDLVVVLSGIVEITFGAAFAFWAKQKLRIGLALGVFYVMVFPGNWHQYVNHLDAFGLDTDRARLIRLFFQPVLVLWALWSSGWLKYYSQTRRFIG